MSAKLLNNFIVICLPYLNAPTYVVTVAMPLYYFFNNNSYYHFTPIPYIDFINVHEIDMCLPPYIAHKARGYHLYPKALYFI